MPLKDRDLDVLQKATLELHEDRDLDGFRDAVPDIVLAAVPGDHFLWMESGFAGAEQPVLNVVRWERPQRFTTKLTQRLMELLEAHPFTAHARRTGDWGPLALADFWSDAELKRSTLWKDVYRHVGIGRLLACAAFRGNRVGTLNVCRPLGAPHFSDRDRTMLQLLLPHYVQALQAAERETMRRQGEGEVLPTLGLTKREVQVAAWLARGRTNGEIARILATQPRTVEKHVERILIKLGVENRTAAAMVVGGRLAYLTHSGPGPDESQAPQAPQAQNGRDTRKPAKQARRPARARREPAPRSRAR